MEHSPETSTIDLAAIALRLREVLDAARMPVADFAEKVGTPYSTFRAYVTGSRAPSAEVLAGIFRLSGFLPSWLLTGEGPRKVGEVQGVNMHALAGALPVLHLGSVKPMASRGRQ